MPAIAISVDLAKLLDKEYGDKTLSEVLAAPVSGLTGVTDPEHLKQAVAHQDRGRFGYEQVLPGRACADRLDRARRQVAVR